MTTKMSAKKEALLKELNEAREQARVARLAEQASYRAYASSGYTNKSAEREFYAAVRDGEEATVKAEELVRKLNR